MEVNAVLESAYTARRQTSVRVMFGCYEIDLKTMKQRNLRTGFCRPVQRIQWLRPDALQATWCAPTEHPCPQLVDIEHLSDEFNFVASLFNKGKAGSVLRTVKRIENHGLLEAFQVKLRSIRRACSDKWAESAMVRWLFHGTEPERVEKIALDPVFGFRALLSGTRNGSNFGEGVYFASEPDYSSQYASAGSGDRSMILTAVVLGRSCEGRKGMKQPLEGCHSLVNRLVDPTIFVVQEGSCAYPAYILTYCC